MPAHPSRLGLALLGATVLSAPLLGQIRPATVPKAIAGRVRDAANQPVAATVYLRWRSHPELPAMIGYTLGDAGIRERKLLAGVDGKFRFKPPNHGPFVLVAHRGDQSSKRIFPVMPGDYHALSLSPTHIMAGVVRSDTGKPVAGARVRLLPTNVMWPRLGLYNQPERRGKAVTDASGRFTIPFEHGYLRDPRWNALMGLHATKGRWHSGTMSYRRPTDSTKSIELVLRDSKTPVVQVIHAGKLVAGATIVDPFDPRRQLRTDADGRCELEGTVAMDLMVFAPGLAPMRVSRGPVTLHATGKVLPQIVALAPGLQLRLKIGASAGGSRVLVSLPQFDARGLEWSSKLDADGCADLRVPTGEFVVVFVEIDGRFTPVYRAVPTADHEVGVPDPPRPIVGQVIAADKTPVAGARVALRAVDAKRAYMPIRITYTDRAGRFRFAAVGSGPHTVVTGHGAHGQVGLHLAAERLNEPLKLEFKKGLEIRGEVKDPDGRPAAGAWVAIYQTVPSNGIYVPAPRSSQTSFCVMADCKGRFRLGGLVANQSYSVLASMIHKGAHCNVRTTSTSGKVNLVLRVTVQNR